MFVTANYAKEHVINALQQIYIQNLTHHLLSTDFPVPLYVPESK